MSGIKKIIPEENMKQQIQICSAFLVAAVLLGGASKFASANPKKDVSDPVLSEVIQNFEPRMPRFVDKHGKDVFVTDAPITRGSLMLALYEYDKSLKIPKKENISRVEFDELKARIKLLEGGAGAKRFSKEDTEDKSQLDITQILNDIAPNMPMLLDDSLGKSKVFMGLRYEVMNLKPQEGTSSGEQTELKKNLEQTELELSELSKKVEAMERVPQQDGNGGSDADTQKMKKDLAQTRSRLSKLEKRMNDIDNTKSDEQISSVRSGSKDAVENTSVLAKISMGLSMVAALFIAR